MGKSVDKHTSIKSVIANIIRIPWRITKPSKKITDEGSRRKARFLSLSLFVATGVFPILQITSQTTDGVPFYSGLSFFIAGLYLLSRTEHIRLTAILTILTSAILPFLILLNHPVWTSTGLGFQLLPWPILAALLGSQLLNTREEAGVIVSVTSGLTILTYFHPGVIFTEAIQYIGVALIVEVFLWFTCWTGEYYASRLEQVNSNLAKRQRELEIYTSLLRHDLSNDIQMILGGLELAQMTRNDLNKHMAFIDSTLAAAERMRSLIHVFSLSDEDLDLDLLSILRTICRRAQIAFKGLQVQLKASKEVEDTPLYYGRLTSLAFENLLRNTAQHAGNNPCVDIELSFENDFLVIRFGDDGPGISDAIRDQLFGKGITTGEKGRGMGLYLTKMVIESEAGHIELDSSTESGCCFIIKLPIKAEERIRKSIESTS